MEAALLVNVSNHPSATAWPKNQTEAARPYGEIVDFPLPSMEADTTLEETEAIAEEYCEKICAMQPDAVIVMGEFVFVYQLVRRLLDAGVTVLSTRSHRSVVETRLFGRIPLRSSRYHFEAFVPYGTPNPQAKAQDENE